MRVATSETGAAWNEFLADLVARGLAGVRLVTSDAHAGLREAIAAKPFGEVCVLAQLGHREVDRADSGVEWAVAVTVALGLSVGARPALLGSEDGVGIRAEQRVDDVRQQGTHKIRRRFGEGLAKQASRVDNVRCGHRDDSSRECCERFTRRTTRSPLSSADEHADDLGDRATPLSSTQLSRFR